MVDIAVSKKIFHSARILSKLRLRPKTAGGARVEQTFNQKP
jgi:hypothetical protein